MEEQRAPWFQRLLQSLFTRLGAGEQGKKMAGGAFWVFAMKITGMGGAFVISVILSRTLGAEGFGEYAYAIAWVQLLLVPSLLGMDRMLVREIPALSHRGEWGLLRGLLRRSQQGVALIAALLGVLLAVVLTAVEPMSEKINPAMVMAVYVALPLLPLMALTRIRQTFLLGLDRVSLSQIPEGLVQPWLMILSLVFIALLAPGFLDPSYALMIQEGAVTISLFVALYFSHRHLPSHVGRAEIQYTVGAWLRSALPIIVLAGIQVINMRVDILMVGSMMGAEPAGVYTVANRGAQLVLLVYFAVNAALAPAVAKLWVEKNIDRMQTVVRKATRVTVLGSLPIAAVLIFGAPWLLLIFGRDFLAGEPALVILTLAQIVLVSFGAVGTILLMTNHEREAAMGSAVSAVLNIGLNLLLIPKYGMIGAAWALFVGQGTSTLVMALIVKRKVGISASPF